MAARRGTTTKRVLDTTCDIHVYVTRGSTRDCQAATQAQRRYQRGKPRWHHSIRCCSVERSLQKSRGRPIALHCSAACGSCPQDSQVGCLAFPPGPTLAPRLLDHPHLHAQHRHCHYHTPQVTRCRVACASPTPQRAPAKVASSFGGNKIDLQQRATNDCGNIWKQQGAAAPSKVEDRRIFRSCLPSAAAGAVR